VNVQAKENCKACSNSVHIEESEIEAAIKKVMDSGVPLTDSKQYEKRMEACNMCEQLIYGTTCMSCGFIVRVRALNALRICPHAAGSRW
jgi:hypothetical protein